MKNFLNPKWLIAINTIPLAILLLIFIGEYRIISSILSDESIKLWKIFGFTLTLLAVVNFIYAVFLINKNKNVSPIYGVIALFSYIPYLYMYGMYSNKIIPFSVPQWMVSDDITVYAGTFLMPTLIYALFIMVIYLTSADKPHKAWKNFLAAVAIPASWYLFIQLILPLWRPYGSGFSEHVIIILVILLTLAFLFFLIRSIYILGLKKSEVFIKYQLFWKIPVSIILPLVGLALNDGHLFNDITLGGTGVFGDFSHYWFYVLAVLNGILICLPNLENKNYRMLLFAGRSLTFTYTLYFFLVFLPFLPLSVIAVVAFGTGFLMLTPLLLFVIHVNELVNDYKFIKNHYSLRMSYAVPVLSLLVIPVSITLAYLHDRAILNETLSYLYAPDYSKNYDIDKSSLFKTLNIIKEHKGKNRNSLFGNQTPYLSSYFSWLVLDNLTLSNTKINNIERVFFAKPKRKRESENIQNSDVKITKLTSSSRFDEDKNAWISQIDFEITNKSKNTSGFSEYATTINLPNGCWISDYYLYVGDRKEMGMLAEKKTAMFVYSQIRNENRDPGILYYLTDNKVAFRVFPFSPKEKRKTGIEFIHKEPVTLNIDSRTVKLGNKKNRNVVVQKEIKDVVYVSTKMKLALSKIYREPYYHFIVDVSKNKNKHKGTFINRIENIISQNIISAATAKVSFVNTYTSTIQMLDNWKDVYSKQTFNGGFYLDRAIKKALFDSYKNKSNLYPVIVVVTDDIENSIVKNNFADFKITYPENKLFYHLNKEGKLISHSLESHSIAPLTKASSLKLNHAVLPFPNTSNPVAYLPDTNTPDIVMVNDIFDIEEISIKQKNADSALLMQGNWISQVLHPERSHKEWLSLVRYSFLSKIMMPVTSYMVVENEAQKAFLKKKQQQVLSGNKLLDLGDDVDRMSEPDLFLLLFLIGFMLWFRVRIIRAKE